MYRYCVYVGQTECRINTARVSAYPINKVWDGTQRSAAQTETAYFATADIDKPTDVKIHIDGDFNNYDIRPHAAKLCHSRDGNDITVHVEKPCQFTVEPNGMHNALHVFINPVSRRPDKDNIVYYGAGRHEAGLIWLESGSELYIDEGAIVHGVIYAKDAQNIKIHGRGIIDSSDYARGNDKNGNHEIIEQLRKKGITEDFHETGIVCSNLILYNCKNVTVEGITLRDSMFWSLITRNGCENITIDNVKIIGQWRYNSDGIDICASKNVTVKNCFVRSFDDCFVARSPYLPEETGTVENITVENCVLWCDWGKSLEIWCGDCPTKIRNVVHKNNYLIHLSALAISVTTWFGSKETIIEDILYENIYIDGDEVYPNLQIETENHSKYVHGETHIPDLIRICAERIGKNLGNQKHEPVKDTNDFNLLFQNITFKNVRCTDRRLPVKIIEQKNLLEIKNVTAQNCSFKI